MVGAQGKACQIPGAEVVQSPDREPSPWSSAPPSGSGRGGHCFYPETLEGESRGKGRESPSPHPLWGPSPRILTGHVVRHLPSIVQQAELPAAQRFPGPLVSQLVPGGDRERKLQIAGLSHAPCLLKRLQERNQASSKKLAGRGHLPAQRLPRRLREVDGFVLGHTAPGRGPWPPHCQGMLGGGLLGVAFGCYMALLRGLRAAHYILGLESAPRDYLCLKHVYTL